MDGMDGVIRRDLFDLIDNKTILSSTRTTTTTTVGTRDDVPGVDFGDIRRRRSVVVPCKPPSFVRFPFVSRLDRKISLERRARLS